MDKELLNQTEFAELYGIKRQRAGQLIASGELMTKKTGKRTYVINNRFNADVVKDFCHGSGQWNRPRNRY